VAFKEFKRDLFSFLVTVDVVTRSVVLISSPLYCSFDVVGKIVFCSSGDSDLVGVSVDGGFKWFVEVCRSDAGVRPSKDGGLGSGTLDLSAMWNKTWSNVTRGLRVLREQLFQLVYSRLRASGVYSYDEESPLYFKAKLAYTEARSDRRL
jgi:hypothetical protein